jgi:hypothetical protein
MQTQDIEENEIIKIGEAARIQNRSTSRLRQFELQGILKPMWLGGLRFYRRLDIEKLKASRDERTGE